MRATDFKRVVKLRIYFPGGPEKIRVMSENMENKQTGLAARIVRQERDYLTARTADAEYLCTVAGRFRLEAGDLETRFPVIGDRVIIEPQNAQQAFINEVLPRINSLKRRKAGKTTELQVLAANIDLALVVHSLDGGRHFNLRRMERFLALTSSNDIPTVLLLNKYDLCKNPDECLLEASSLFHSIPILPLSAKTGFHLEELRGMLKPESTSILIGASGVGKSALINALMEQSIQRETAARESDKRGRHTTTNRQLFQLPGGAWIIDTPGIREIQTWVAPENTDAFTDIEELAQSCRFRDCRHENEPGCAVQEALNAGILSPERHRNYVELHRQHRELTRSREESSRLAEKRNWKQRKYR